MTQTFFDELPFTTPLMRTLKGDAAVHLHPAPGLTNTVYLKWLASLQRGAGRAAMELITASADRNGVTLILTAKPENPAYGAGKKLSKAELEAFYAGFDFTVSGRGEYATMTRKPKG